MTSQAQGVAPGLPTWATGMRDTSEGDHPAYRRMITTVLGEGEITLAIEQELEAGSVPILNIEVDGERVAGFHNPATLDALIEALRTARAQLTSI